MLNNKELYLKGANATKDKNFKLFLPVLCYAVINIIIFSICLVINKDSRTKWGYLFSITGVLFIPIIVGIKNIFLKNSYIANYEITLDDMFYFYKRVSFDLLIARIGVVIKCIIGFMLLILPGVLWSLDYSQVLFIIAEKHDIDYKTALNKSKMLMKNRRGELLLLYLSFTPKILLGVITLGIYFIKVVPEINSTLAMYYQLISAEYYDNSKESV